MRRSSGLKRDASGSRDWGGSSRYDNERSKSETNGSANDAVEARGNYVYWGLERGV